MRPETALCCGLKWGHLVLAGRIGRYWLRHPVRHTPILRRWSRTVSVRTVHRDPLAAALPWLPLPAITWLDQTVHPAMRVLEWGSGGSTRFLAARVGQLVSIEYDPAWYAAVRAHLAADGVTVDLRLIAPETGPGISADSRCQRDGQSYAAYARIADSFPEQAFDLILVDGRVRNDCIRHAIPRLRRGGWLLLDNADRPAYAAGRALLSGWPTRTFYGPVACITDFGTASAWQRP